MVKDTLFFDDEPEEQLPPEQLALALKRDLYDAMADDKVQRKWKKQAIQMILEIDETLKDLDAGNEKINGAALKKIIRKAEDLLNQLN